MTLAHAAIFRWIDRKSWILALTAPSVYTKDEHPISFVLLVGLTFAHVNLPSLLIWAVFRVSLRPVLSNPIRLKCFNIGIGVLLALTYGP